MKIFIGYDSRESITYNLCRYSLLKHSQGITTSDIYKLSLDNIKDYYTREDKLGSTEFSLSRFLTPYICNKIWPDEEVCVFMDCDFIWERSLLDVLDHLDKSKPVSCVQHDYVPKHQIKMDGKKQYVYPYKNWSSFMVFNMKFFNTSYDLNPSVINSESGKYLHQFEWLQNRAESIGSLPLGFNYLCDEDMPETKIWAKHFTNGTPEVGYDSEQSDLFYKTYFDFSSSAVI